MLLNRSADDFGGHLVTDGTGKIPILAKRPAPPAPFEARKRPENRSSTQALETSHALDDRVPGWEGAQKRDRVSTHLPFLKRGVIGLRNSANQFPYALLALALQNIADR